MSIKHRRKLGNVFAFLSLVLIVALISPVAALAAPAAQQAPEQAPEVVVNFPAGSLIIPMDTTYQNSGMWLAYGYIYRLLTNNIPVYWAIEPTKAYNGTDFTATNIVNARTNAAVAASVNYSSGPFVVHADNAVAAVALLTAPFATQPIVHKANSAFSAEVNIVLRRAPRIAIEDINANIATAYMTAAGIPLAAAPGLPGYRVINQASIAAGGLFQNDVCSNRRYDVYLTPHNSGFSYSLTDTANLGTRTYAELDRFVQRGGGWVALCESIPSNENAINDLFRNSNAAVRAMFAPLPVTGGFLTQTGLDTANKNNGSKGTWTVDPNWVSLPVAQIAPVANPANMDVPGGSVGSWRSPLTGSTNTQYWGETERVAYFTEAGLQYDQVINGVYHNGLGQGKMTFVGGHSHSTSLPYSGNSEAPYLRAIYNSLFFNGAAVANMTLLLLGPPPFVNINTPTPFQFELKNIGASIATSVQDVQITLEPGIVFNGMDSGPAPATNSNPGNDPTLSTVLTWAPFGDVNPDTVILRINATTPAYPTDGSKQFATLYARYGDVFLESFTAQTCHSLQVINPLAVTLGSFEAVLQGNSSVAVSWETFSELNNAGFNLYRAGSVGEMELLAFVPSQSPGGTTGAFYSYVDNTVTGGNTYYYYLEDVNLAGVGTMHDPVSVDVPGPTAVALRGISASPAAAGSLTWLWVVAGVGMALGASRLRRRS